jgi:hypothetical protein
MLIINGGGGISLFDNSLGEFIACGGAAQTVMPPTETACRRIPARGSLFFPLFNRDSKNQGFKDSMAVDRNGRCVNIHSHPAKGHFILHAARFCTWILKKDYQHGENTENNVRMSQYASAPVHFHTGSFSHSHISTIMSHPLILSPMETEQVNC